MLLKSKALNIRGNTREGRCISFGTALEKELVQE